MNTETNTPTLYTVREDAPNDAALDREFPTLEGIPEYVEGLYSAQIMSPGWIGYVVRDDTGWIEAKHFPGGDIPEDAVLLMIRLENATA